MKIVFDHKIFYQQKFGGPSRYFFKLFEGINSFSDDEAFVVSPIYHNKYLIESKFKNRIRGMYLPQIKYLGSSFNLINNLSNKNLINKIKPQILHTTDYSKLSSDNIKPLVVTVHDLIHEIFYKDFGQSINYRPKKEILKKADHIICVSENTKKDLIKYYSTDEKKITVIYHGNSFSSDEFYPLNEIPINLNYKFFLYIGSRKRYKNFYSIIKAFKKDKDIYKNYKLICFGGGPLLTDEKKQLIEDNFDLKKIILYSNDDDKLLYKLYKSATALIYPSLYEGFGMPVVEAMSLGCPVICSNTSSLPEINGSNALSYSPYSEDELLKKMIEITQDKDLKKDVVSQGIKNSNKFSWKKCCKETISIYKKLI
jgi:glycosyltransferase involved in cell wall biosynthesis